MAGELIVMNSVAFSDIEHELRQAFPVISRLDLQDDTRILAFEIQGLDFRRELRKGVGSIVEAFKSAMPADACLTEAPMMSGETLLYSCWRIRQSFQLCLMADHLKHGRYGFTIKAWPEN